MPSDSTPGLVLSWHISFTHTLCWCYSDSQQNARQSHGKLKWHGILQEFASFSAKLFESSCNVWSLIKHLEGFVGYNGSTSADITSYLMRGSRVKERFFFHIIISLGSESSESDMIQRIWLDNSDRVPPYLGVWQWEVEQKCYGKVIMKYMYYLKNDFCHFEHMIFEAAPVNNDEIVWLALNWWSNFQSNEKEITAT